MNKHLDILIELFIWWFNEYSTKKWIKLSKYDKSKFIKEFVYTYLRK